MKKIVEDLEILKKDKKYLMKKGDVFVYKIPFEDFYRYGLVVSTDLELWSESKKGETGTIVLYNNKSKEKKLDIGLTNDKVIISDVILKGIKKISLINVLNNFWEMGYFETIGNIEITKEVFDDSEICFWTSQYDNLFFNLNGKEIKPNISNLWILDKTKYNKKKCFPTGFFTNPKSIMIKILGYENPLPDDADYIILDLDESQEFLYDYLENKINFNLESEKILKECEERINDNEELERENESKVLVILEIFAIANKGRRKNLHGGLVRKVKSDKIQYNKEENKERYIKIIDYMLNSGKSEIASSWRNEEYRNNWKKAMLELRERLS